MAHAARIAGAHASERRITLIAVDTNILVRLIVNDDPKQVSKARALMVGGSVAITSGVLIETVWVLSKTYALDRPTVARALAAVLALPNVVVPWPASVKKLLEGFLAGMDFADMAHLFDAKALGCTQLASFDTQLRKRTAHTAMGIEVIAP